MKRSTGLCNTMLLSQSFKQTMDGSIINMYSGTEPASADDALGSDAVLIVTYSLNGGGSGVTFDTTAAARAIVKNTGEVWSGTIVASGTPTYFRMSPPADDGTASTVTARLQGTVALANADILVSSLTFTAGDERVMRYFTVSMDA